VADDAMGPRPHFVPSGRPFLVEITPGKGAWTRISGHPDESESIGWFVI
jgi:hypothetical protein